MLIVSINRDCLKNYYLKKLVAINADEKPSFTDDDIDFTPTIRLLSKVWHFINNGEES